MKSLKAMYHDGKENFIIDFSTFSDKLEQVERAKSRWQVISVIIAVKWWTRSILSNHIYLQN